MIESLEYLKKKPVKSKQDKISIEMLEAVLKNIIKNARYYGHL
jgi:hypothetical protein